jgi:hypothetical protein
MITRSSLTECLQALGSSSSMPRRHITHPFGFIVHDEHIGAPCVTAISASNDTDTGKERIHQ